MLCSHCGKEIPVGSATCPYCGCTTGAVGTSPFKKAGDFDTAPESHAAPTPAASGDGEERSAVIFSRPRARSAGSETPSGAPTGSFSDGAPASAPAAHSSAETPKGTFCRECGAKIAPGNRFCSECGAPTTPGPDPATQRSSSPSESYVDATIDLAHASRAELKELAKKQINGRIGILFLISLICFGISVGIAFILFFVPVVGAPVNLLIGAILTPMFSLSLCHIYLNVTAHGKVAVGDAFCGFDDLWSAIKVNFFMGLFTALWSFLLVIPGIIKGLSYSMSFYILAENKGMPALECIRRSKELTRGHKGELFVLHLSFFGWYLLESITFGIAGIYVTPYVRTTTANFYRKLKSLAHS